MNARKFTLQTCLVISVILLGYVVWKQYNPGQPTSVVESETPPEAATNPPIELPPATPGDPVAIAARTNPMPVMPEVPGNPNWQAKLDDILRATTPEAAKAEELLKLVSSPGLDADAQAEVMQHVVNLLPDDRFPALKEMIVNPQTSEGLLDVLTTDLLNRPNSIKLPIILEMAQTPGHPKAEESMSLLQVFLEGDYGQDWNQWQIVLQKWLAENPDEPADPAAPGKIEAAPQN